MGQPVVHFEIEGMDGDALRRFYSDLFGWKIDAALFISPRRSTRTSGVYRKLGIRSGAELGARMARGLQT